MAVDYGKVSYMRCDEIEAKLGMMNAEEKVDGATVSINKRQKKGYGKSIDIGRIYGKSAITLILSVEHDSAFFELYCDGEKVAISYTNTMFATLSKHDTERNLSIKAKKDIFSVQVCAIGEKVKISELGSCDVGEKLGVTVRANILSVYEFDNDLETTLGLASKACVCNENQNYYIIYVDIEGNVILISFDNNLGINSSDYLCGEKKLGNNVSQIIATCFNGNIVMGILDDGKVRMLTISSGKLGEFMRLEFNEKISKIAFVKNSSMPMLLLNTISGVIYVKKFFLEKEINDHLSLKTSFVRSNVKL